MTSRPFEVLIETESNSCTTDDYAVDVGDELGRGHEAHRKTETTSVFVDSPQPLVPRHAIVQIEQEKGAVVLHDLVGLACRHLVIVRVGSQTQSWRVNRILRTRIYGFGQKVGSKFGRSTRPLLPSRGFAHRIWWISRWWRSKPTAEPAM